MYSTNPFLQMLAAIGDDEDLQQPGGSGGGGQQQQQEQQLRIGRVQLGEFWPQAPKAWFAAADLKFQVANITSERDRFAHAGGAMGFNMLRAVMDLVENPPAVDPYTTLRGRLVLAHQLTPVQKAIRCLQVEASSSQRPSDVLASLLEFCPPGEQGTALFRGAFTMRLPVAIQAHLAGTELTDIKELAQMADRLWQSHGPQPVAAVEEVQSEEDDEDVVAALQGKKRFQQSHPKDQRGYQGRQVAGGGAGGGKSQRGYQGRQVAGGKAGRSKEDNFLCQKHATYGEAAWYCEDEDCTWSEN